MLQKGESGTGCLGKVFSRSDSGGVVNCGGDLSVVGANVAEAIVSSLGIPETCDEVEGKKAEGRFVAEYGNIQIASESGDTTTSDPHGQDICYSGRIGGLTAYLLGMLKGWQHTNCFIERGHNHFRPTWTGYRLRWQNRWPYCLSSRHAQGETYDTRVGG